MTFKEYIDRCSWEELKSTTGCKNFMERSLADLKRLEPKYTDETAKCTIHFSDDSLDEDHDEQYVRYHAFVKSADSETDYAVFETAWDEMLPLEVVIETGQTISDNEIIAAVIWELTWKGSTSEECKTEWDKIFSEAGDLKG